MSRLSNELLRRCCEEGDLDSIKHYIIAQKYDVNAEIYLGYSPLCVCCELGHLDIVQFLLTIPSCDPNVSNLQGDTPLHLAVRTKSSKCVAALLASTICDPNILNGDANTPLHIACQQGSVEIIDLLLSCERLDIYVRNAKGKLPLHATNLETINYFMNSEHYSLNEQDDEGNTVLHMTVQTNASVCVAILLTSASCDPNKRNIEGDTPLHIACQQGLVEIIDILLSSEKLDISSANAQGRTPLQIVFQKKHIRLIVKLLEKSCKYLIREKILREAIDLAQKYGIGSLLHLACTYGCTGIIELFLGSSYCTVEAVNEPDMNGNTPLHIATRKKMPTVTKMLLACQGIDANVRNSAGETALIAACSIDCFECAQILACFQGCDPNKQDNTGSTALHVAVQHSNCELISILLSISSCDPNKSNLQGDTPLLLAVRTKSSKCVEILLTSTSCDSNVICDCTGDTPLHIASRMGSVGIVQLITKSFQCNPNILNHRGEAPLHIAIKSNPSFSISKLLLQTKIICNPNIVNAAGETPLHIACKLRKINIIEMLLKSDQCDPNISADQGMTALHIAIEDTHVYAKIVEPDNTECGNISNLDGDTPLHLAVQSQRITCVKLLLASAFCDPNVINSKGDTPLHIACRQGSVEIIDSLLCSEKIDLHIPNTHGKTSLHILFQMKWFAMIATRFLERDCSPNYLNKEEIFQEAIDLAQACEIGSLLHLACLYGSVRIVEFFLGSSYCTVAAVNKPDANGDTPLHIAARRNMVSIVEMLLACQDVDPNAKNAGGETALITACSSDCFECTQILLTIQGCDLNKQDNEGNTALHVAVHHGNSDLVRILLCNHSYNPSISDLAPLHLPVKIKGIKFVKPVRISASCDPNIVNSKGDTPLHIACWQGSIEIIDLLLGSEKINLYVTNLEGQMPFHVANHEAIKFLVKCGDYSLNEQDSEGNTVLHLAVQTKDIKSVSTLLTDPSCDPNIVTNKGDTPLHIACRQGCIEIIDLLLGTKRINLQAMNAHGKLPLHVANVQAIGCLVEGRHYSINERDIKGNTILHLAVQAENTNCVKTLLASASCDPNAVNNEGNTPLHIACQQGSVEIIDFLFSFEKLDLYITNADECKMPLHVASMEAIKHLLKCKKYTLDERDGKGNTVLHLAVQMENSNCVKTLLASASCDPNVVNSKGDTPLHIACWQGSVEIIDLLLSSKRLNIENAEDQIPLHVANVEANAKCDPHSSDKDVTLLQLAFEGQYFNIVQFLLEKGTSPHHPNREQIIEDAAKLTSGNLFFDVCSWGNITIAENLFNSDWYRSGGASIKNKNGDTLFHVCVAENQPAMLQLIIDHNILCVLDGNQETPLQIAYKLRNYVCVSILEDYSTGGIGASGNTLLHDATRNGNISLMKALLSSKSYNPDECNPQGETPLHMACKVRNLECVKVLSNDKRCNVNKQNKTGDTALHIAIHEEQISIIMYLNQEAHCNPAITNADGNTPLHIACNKGAWKAQSSMLTTVRLLLSTGRVDPECVNNDGRTPIELAGGNHQIVKELSLFVDTKLKHPIQNYVKLFFMGNAYAGKSTLIQAVCTEASKLRKLALSSQYKQVTGVEPLTAGIVPLPFRSKHFGNAILYDFAGQHEYYSSHAAVLENLVSSSPPIFLLVFNLSEPIEQIRVELAYWWSFIGSHCKRTSVTPHVILIASHKDVIKSKGLNVKERMAQIFESLKQIPATFHIAGHVTLDCRRLVSNGLGELLTLLKDTCQKVRKNVTVDLRCHVLYAFLTDKFQHQVACTASEVQDAIKVANTLLPQNSTDLENLLSTLRDKDQILFFNRSSQRFEDSWIVLQRQTLLSNVNGSIFAPKNFRQYIKDFAQSTGIVPLSKIKQKFPNYHPEIIVGSLIYLEFCFKIDDYNALDIFASDSNPQNEADIDNETFYFFPALVQVETPTNVWKPNPQMTFQCSWFYECVHRFQFLTSRFLHVLILRLAFSFALAVDHTSSDECPVIRRRCSMWKRGIAWWNRDGIETIVEVGLQRHWMVVMMRCARDQQIECVALRTAVVKSILDTKDEFCPSVLMQESLISPSSIQYPIQTRDEIAFYCLKEVAITMIKGKSYVTNDAHDPIQLRELLPFEAYSGLSEKILVKLFAGGKKKVTDSDLNQIAEKAYHNLQLFKAAVKPNPLTWQRWCEQAGSNEVLLCVYLLHVFLDGGSKTFKELQTQLSKFSIFCGRNPLVSTYDYKQHTVCI